MGTLNYDPYNKKQAAVDPAVATIKKTAFLGVVGLVALVIGFGSCYSVEAGSRGVLVRMGDVKNTTLPPGWGFKIPLVDKVVDMSVRQAASPLDAECFSSDLQQVNVHLKVLYRIPETSVTKVFRDYSGNPFDSLIAPRVQEALKEVTALLSAELIAKQREEVKVKTLALAKQKVGDILFIEDLVVENVNLSDQLKHAIEAKMVQEQEAGKAKFKQQQAEIDATTAVIQAKGEAEAIRIRGEALKANRSFIELKIVERWDGKAPLVVGDGGGAKMLIPMTNGLSESSK